VCSTSRDDQAGTRWQAAHLVCLAARAAPIDTQPHNVPGDARARCAGFRALGELPRLRAQVGMFGGTPAGGMQFGAAHGSDAHVPCATMLGARSAGRR